MLENYLPNECESEFKNSLFEFVSLDNTCSDDLIRQKGILFQTAFDRLMNNLSGEINQIIFILSCLIEAFDKSKINKTAQLIDSYLFEVVIPSYKNLAQVQNTIETYSNSEYLNNKIFKIRLKRQLTQRD